MYNILNFLPPTDIEGPRFWLVYLRDVIKIRQNPTLQMLETFIMVTKYYCYHEKDCAEKLTFFAVKPYDSWPWNLHVSQLNYQNGNMITFGICDRSVIPNSHCCTNATVGDSVFVQWFLPSSKLYYLHCRGYKTRDDSLAREVWKCEWWCTKADKMPWTAEFKISKRAHNVDNAE